jgi:hypothetical protein
MTGTFPSEQGSPALHAFPHASQCRLLPCDRYRTRRRVWPEQQEVFPGVFVVAGSTGMTGVPKIQMFPSSPILRESRSRSMGHAPPLWRRTCDDTAVPVRTIVRKSCTGTIVASHAPPSPAGARAGAGGKTPKKRFSTEYF